MGTSSVRWLCAIFAAAILFCGCGRLWFERNVPSDAGPSDGDVALDGASDSGAFDAALSDAALDGASDGGALDASGADASAIDADTDAGLTDASFIDASGLDASPADAEAGEPTLTVRVTGAGFGEVFLNNIPMECGRSCTREVAVGTRVNLTVRADDASWFRGWSAGPCSGRAACEFTIDGDVTVDADFTPRPNRIFVTSETYDGDLGGIAGADAICQGHADAASLGGTWRALLQTPTEDWHERLTGSRGWVRVDGAPVLDSPVSNALLLGAVAIDENGMFYAAESIWMTQTGSTNGCLEYSSNSPSEEGRADYTYRGASFGSGGRTVACDTRSRLLCAEVGIVQAVMPVPTIGRGAFVSNSAWALDSGRSAADAVCASDAAAAGRSGTYLALVAEEGERPLDRFDLDRPPWVRADGMAFLPRARDWETAEHFDAAPSLSATGTPMTSQGYVEGAGGPGGVGPSTNCDNWSNEGEMSIRIACGRTWDVRANCGSRAVGYLCSASIRVFCLEE